MFASVMGEYVLLKCLIVVYYKINHHNSLKRQKRFKKKSQGSSMAPFRMGITEDELLLVGQKSHKWSKPLLVHVDQEVSEKNRAYPKMDWANHKLPHLIKATHTFGHKGEINHHKIKKKEVKGHPWHRSAWGRNC
jgi:hypothetical protein